MPAEYRELQHHHREKPHCCFTHERARMAGNAKGKFGRRCELSPLVAFRRGLEAVKPGLFVQAALLDVGNGVFHRHQMPSCAKSAMRCSHIQSMPS